MPELVDCALCREARDAAGVIMENGYWLAKLDPNPVSPGHALVISRRHVASVFELSPEEGAALLQIVKDVRHYLNGSYHPDAYNVGLNEGEAAGRTIAHVHLHLIPRYKGDVSDPRGGVRNVIPGKGPYPFSP